MVTTQHIVTAYDDELEALDRMVAEMGGRVEQLLSDAVSGLIRSDAETAQNVVAEDKNIDQLELDINQQATQLLALRQPMAADLRAVVASLKIANDLERMGDYSKNIAKRTITLSNTSFMPSMSRSIENISRMVGDMISNVLDAYRKRNSELAKDVIAQDESVDQLYTSLFREILTYMMEDPRNITICTHYLFIVKNIERIGDHATNIAEQIYYVAEGAPYEEGHPYADETSNIT
ncbi:phosphate signaling complex protein PhoU [Kordiimonas sp. SCSIO 12610]|uniref:phosphate signaling complex protein PhoU n=1 Tax=Kordiimonas sp. SCSIO 12610 TaxID=2829597 RepID=UPI00210E0E77|nr:phosphate signaling complex protein PhoU [Kordiimonas sp. SCSIO 12610]UTW55392.1 phosphate signaling complex protein PhoU [Kordiimonas sp. SCSIO 12610]